MHKEGFQSITNARLLCLCVYRDQASHLQVCRFIDKNMTDAIVMLDNRHPRKRYHRFDQTLASPRNYQIQVAIHGSHFFYAFPVGERYQLNRKWRKPLSFASGLQRITDCPIRVNCLGSTSQNSGVTRLKAEDRGVTCHVRATFKNDSYDAHGNPDLLDFYPVWPLSFI